MFPMTDEPSQRAQTRWRWWGAGLLAVAALMFGAGYLFGGSQASKDDSGAPPAGETGVEAQGVSVASLNDLLPGLEAKVAASPRDTSQRMLLAQTYMELGQTDKGIGQLRQLRQQTPGDVEVTILLATALMQRANAADLKEASSLLDAALRAKPAVVPMVRLYQGEIRMKLGDTAGALKIWKQYVGQMSAGDPRRQMFLQRIEQVGGTPQ
jgi:cytochrome c-type biogenesis protein CcmH/NrfG